MSASKVAFDKEIARAEEAAYREKAIREKAAANAIALEQKKAQAIAKEAERATAAVTKEAQRAASEAEAAAAKTSAAWKTHAENISRAVGIAFTAVGTAITGAVTIASKASIDFETAFAEVKKSVGGTDEQLGVMSDSIRNMAKEIPVTASDLAGLAANAGQFGIARENVMAFTRVLADLKVSSDLAGDAGAKMIADFATLTGMPQTQFSNLGSSIVALGNVGSGTESAIMAMAMRIAGAGAQANMSQGDILGLANGLVSMSYTAEQGGTNFSKLLGDMTKTFSFATTGIKELDMRLATGRITQDEYNIAVEKAALTMKTYEDITGMTGEALSNMFVSNPVEAVLKVATGFKRMNDEGRDMYAIVEDLQLTGDEMTSMLLRLANSEDTMTGSVKIGNTAFKENTALAKEAGERYKTTGSQIQILKNILNDLGITVGDTLNPKVREFAQWLGETAGKLQEWIKQNPELTTTLAQVAAVIGGVMLALGPLLIMLPGIIAFITSLIAVWGALAAFLGGGWIVAIVAFVTVELIALAAAFYFYWDEIWAATVKFGDDLYNAFADAGEWLIETWDSTWQWIKDAPGRVWDFIVEVVTDGAGWVYDILADAGEWIGGAFDAAWDMLVSGAEWAWDSLVATFMWGVEQAWALIQPLIDAVMWLPNQVSNLAGQASNYLGIGGGAMMPQSPALMMGGQGFGGGGTTNSNTANVNFNMGGVSLSGDQDARRLSKTLATQMRTELRGLGYAT